MITVKLLLYSRLQHNAMIVAGFHELEKQKVVKLQIVISENGSQIRNLPFYDIIEAVINEKLVIAFDMLDGYCFDVEKVDKYLKEVNYYFKRSFSTECNQCFSEDNRKKIFPLSFNWNVSYFMNPIEWDKSFHGVLKCFIRKLIFRNDLNYYEKQKKQTKNLVLFMCRLWDPAEHDASASPELSEERIIINKTRIEILRKLQSVYGSKFIGGVEDSKISRELCPDLILPSWITNRRKYINIMKHASVCIATTGLHQSIGWKFAEYVAAGKAIVTEPLCYEVIGDFKSGVNYLTFNNADECVNAEETILGDKNLLQQMQKSNREYYFNFARPERQIQYALSVANLL